MDSATRTVAIVLAQTIVDAPKNGAISRAAAISAPRVDTPTEKTTRYRRRWAAPRPARAGAAGAPGGQGGHDGSRDDSVAREHRNFRPAALLSAGDRGVMIGVPLSGGEERRMKRLALLVAMGGLALTLSSCYFNEARKAKEAGGPVPWWCTATEEIPVTSGPAVGNVDWYAGTHKAPLNWDDCIEHVAAFDGGKQFAEQWGTRGAAEAAGFREMTNYIPGMGTHHARGGVTAEMLAPAPTSTARTRSWTTRGSTARSTRRRRRCCSSGATVGRQARRLRLLRPHDDRSPAGGLRRQQRLVAPPSVDLLPQVRRRDDRVQRDRRLAAPRRTAST